MKGIRMLLHPWFIILFLLFSGHQIAQKLLELKHVLLDSYLDPLLLMPLLLHLVLWERRYLFNKGQSYTLPLKDIIILLVIVSVLSEYALPLWSSAFTADKWDILCYFMGSCSFYYRQRAEKFSGKKYTVKDFRQIS